MTYNSKMGRTSLQSEQQSVSERAAGWQPGLGDYNISILFAIASLGIAVLSPDQRRLPLIVSHQTLTPFITIGFAVIGALIASATDAIQSAGFSSRLACSMH